MTHPYFHARSSAKKWGGTETDYLPIHNWFDASKQSMAHFTHRVMRHHAEGIFECQEVFGQTITNSDGDKVPVRYIAEQHVKEDCGGFIPSLKDWLIRIQPEPWMSRGYEMKEHEYE